MTNTSWGEAYVYLREIEKTHNRQNLKQKRLKFSKIPVCQSRLTKFGR